MYSTFHYRDFKAIGPEIALQEIATFMEWVPPSDLYLCNIVFERCCVPNNQCIYCDMAPESRNNEVRIDVYV
jgi:hypothetical protein